MSWSNNRKLKHSKYRLCHENGSFCAFFKCTLIYLAVSTQVAEGSVLKKYMIVLQNKKKLFVELFLDVMGPALMTVCDKWRPSRRASRSLNNIIIKLGYQGSRQLKKRTTKKYVTCLTHELAIINTKCNIKIVKSLIYGFISSTL